MDSRRDKPTFTPAKLRAGGEGPSTSKARALVATPDATKLDHDFTSPDQFCGLRSPPSRSGKPRNSKLLFGGEDFYCSGKVDDEVSVVVDELGGGSASKPGCLLMEGGRRVAGTEDISGRHPWSGASGGDVFATPKKGPIKSVFDGSVGQRNLGALFYSPLPEGRSPGKMPDPSVKMPDTKGKGHLAQEEIKKETKGIGSKSAESCIEEPACTGLAPKEEVLGGLQTETAEGSKFQVELLDKAEEETAEGPEFQVKVPDKAEEEITEGSEVQLEVPDKAEAEIAEGPEVQVEVSDAALKSLKREELCTLEVLVKHSRDRIGVTGCASWRVSELKRRLVFLKHFSDAGAIDVVPRYGEDSLADGQILKDLDIDVTYEARRIAG